MARAKQSPKTPLPKAHQDYYQARANLRANIRKFKRLQYSMHGQRWIDSQVAYWERCLADLKAEAPLGTDDNPDVE